MQSMETKKLDYQNIREQQRRIKPGACLKYVTALLDQECVCGNFASPILQKLMELGVNYKIQSNKVPRTILWERVDAHSLQSYNNLLTLTEKYNTEPHLIYVMFGEELVENIRAMSLGKQMKILQDAYPNTNKTLLIFGMKKLCRQEAINIKRYDIEKALTEIQLFYNTSHRLLETALELAATISQYSKAVAEIPFKKQQSDKYSDANFYLLNDNKDCVRVEGSAGLSRLWQQHLTRLPLVTLETAEAVMSKYPAPRQLLDAYDSTINGQELLLNLKVRRAGGLLATDRRVGFELSRKIHTLYTSLDPNEKL